MMYSYDSAEDNWEVPEKFCSCYYCENYDGSWLVCKLACKRNGIVAETGKEFDAIIEAMDENSEIFKAIDRKEDDICDEFEFDYSYLDDYDPYEDYDPFED